MCELVSHVLNTRVGEKGTLAFPLPCERKNKIRHCNSTNNDDDLARNCSDSGYVFDCYEFWEEEATEGSYSAVDVLSQFEGQFAYERSTCNGPMRSGTMVLGKAPADTAAIASQFGARDGEVISFNGTVTEDVAGDSTPSTVWVSVSDEFVDFHFPQRGDASAASEPSALIFHFPIKKAISGASANIRVAEGTVQTRPSAPADGATTEESDAKGDGAAAFHAAATVHSRNIMSLRVFGIPCPAAQKQQQPKKSLRSGKRNVGAPATQPPEDLSEERWIFYRKEDPQQNFFQRHYLIIVFVLGFVWLKFIRGYQAGMNRVAKEKPT